jgi:site-specific DNA-methyltransferase (adenine-specific)
MPPPPLLPFTMLELDKIHTTDCFHAATEIPDNGVDVIITDPPYPNRNHQFEDTLVDGLAMLYLGCKKAKKYVIFFWNPFTVPPPPPGWFEVARHVWHKPDCRTIIHYESIVIWSKEEKSKPSKVWSIPILDYRSLRDWKPHPTQKPVKLLRFLVEDYTNEGDIVFDPFVGSGTTAVACQWAKRHFIACEINPEYAAIATSRLKEPKKEEALAPIPPTSTAEGVTQEEMTPTTSDEHAEVTAPTPNTTEAKPKRKHAAKPKPATPEAKAA